MAEDHDVYDKIAERVFREQVANKCLALEDCGWMNREDREAVWKPFADAFRDLAKQPCDIRQITWWSKS